MGVYYSCVNDKRREFFSAIDVGTGVCKSGGVTNATFCAMVTFALYMRPNSENRGDGWIQQVGGWRLEGDWEEIEHPDYRDVSDEILHELRTDFECLASMMVRAPE